MNFIIGVKEGIISKRVVSSLLSSENNLDRYQPSLISIQRVYFGLEKSAIKLQYRPYSLDLINLSAIPAIRDLCSLTKSSFIFFLIRSSIPNLVVPHSNRSGSEKRGLEKYRSN